MNQFKNVIKAKAKERIPGIYYNRYLKELLEKNPNVQPITYEVTVKDGEGWEQFRDRVFPPFVRYMKSKKIDPEYPKGVVVPVFFDDMCYILEGNDLIDVLKEIEDLNSAALHFRVLQWLD